MMHLRTAQFGDVLCQWALLLRRPSSVIMNLGLAAVGASNPVKSKEDIQNCAREFQNLVVA